MNAIINGLDILYDKRKEKMDEICENRKKFDDKFIDKLLDL